MGGHRKRKKLKKKFSGKRNVLKFFFALFDEEKETKWPFVSFPKLRSG